MRMILAAALACAAPFAAQAQAQTQPQAAPTDIDPARLTAARKLIEQIMPPEEIDKLMDTMIASVTGTMRQAFMQNPEMAKIRAANPKAAAAMDRMMERQQRRGLELVKASMPAMKEAMARAYARRFTLPQIADLSAFFATPSGQAYLRQAPTVMADPDVGAWMSSLMRDAMARMPEDIATLTAEIEAIEKEDAK